MKGLLAYVYRNGSSDCTANGISSTHDKLIIVGEGVPEIFEADEETPAVKLVKRNIGGRERLSVKPLDGFKDGITSGKWYMFGGNFLSCSDSRFPSDYPIPIHDRYEG